MLTLTDYFTPNVFLFLVGATFLIISFRQAAWLLFRALIFVVGVLLCVATGIFSINFMMLGISAPPSPEWYDMGTLMYFARFIFGGTVIFAQVKGFVSWQRGQGGKALCIGATALSVFMSVYTFHSDMAKSAARASQANVKNSAKYITLSNELSRLKELRDSTEQEKTARIEKLMSLGRYIKQSEQEMHYFDERISDFSSKIEAIANELDSTERQKAKGGATVSTKSTFAGIARDVVFFFDLDRDYWQPRLEMLLQYLMIAGLSLLADCAAMSFILFGLGLLDEVQEHRSYPIWLLQLRPQVLHLASDAWEKVKVILGLIRARVDASRFSHDAPLPVASDADFKAPNMSSDAILKSDAGSDFLSELIEESSDVLGDDASLPSQQAPSEVKVDGITVRGFDDAESAKQFMIDAYQKKPFYRHVYREIGISPNPSSARMLKAVLDEAGIHHGKKKKVNGKSRSIKKTLLHPVTEAGSLA